MTGERDVVAIPGRIGGPYAPWVMYPCDAAENRGTTVHCVHSPTAGDPLVTAVESFLDEVILWGVS
jgi:hypothetical protein